MKKALIFLVGLNLLLVSGLGCDKKEDPVESLDLPDNVTFNHLPRVFRNTINGTHWRNPDHSE